MTVVQNTATDPGGEPLAQINVRINLIAGTAATAPGYTATGDILGTYTTITNQAGSWSANLTPNTLITPANTYYRVVENGSISNIVVPASGGPYNLAQLLVTSPATPNAPGITGVQVAANGSIAGSRPEINVIAGTNVTLSASDNPTNNRVDLTVNASGGVQIAGDLGGTPASPQVTGTHLGSPLPLAQGGTNAATASAARTQLGVAYDATAADYQPIGVAAAGTNGLVADSGHVHPHQPHEFYVKAYGAKGDNTTDDTAAINGAVSAAFSYAQAHNGYAEIVFDPLTYLVAGAPTTGGATQGSAQIPLPIVADTAQKITLVFRGTRDQTGLYHWLQTTPQRAGTVLRSTYNGGNTIPTTGEVSVIGGPTPHFLGDPPSAFNNMLVVVDGITIELANPANMCGVDFRCMAEANVPNASTFGSITGTGAPAVPAANWGFGLAMPVVNNNDNANIGWYSTAGLVYGLIVYEHVEATSIRIINCFDGLVCWSSSGFPHRNKIHYVSIEGCQQQIVLAGGFNKLDIDVADIEWGGGHIINDVGATPGIGRIGLCSNGGNGTSLNNALNSGPTAINVVNGALALEVLNLDQALGPVTAPTVPASGTALTNPFWRHAQVHISGGTVTQVAVDGVNQLSTSGAFDVPSGHSITLTYSVAPSWAWTLKG